MQYVHRLLLRPAPLLRRSLILSPLKFAVRRQNPAGRQPAKSARLPFSAQKNNKAAKQPVTGNFTALRIRYALFFYFIYLASILARPIIRTSN
jgi:hypothetical protein